MAVNLPEWARPHPTDRNAILVDPDLAYPHFFKLLGVEKPTKYWIEVAYQMVKMDLQVAMGKFGFTIHIRGDDGRKDRWALERHPGSAQDVHRATQGKDARQYYRKIRGFVPA